MRRAEGFTLVELLLSAVLSSVIVLALVGGLVVFSSRASEERASQRLQAEVEFTQRTVRSELEQAVRLPAVRDFEAVAGLPGPVQLALVLPQGNQYVLVLYCLGLLPEGFPYDDPNFKTRYGALRSGLYRWESPPFDDPQNPPIVDGAPETAVDPDSLNLVTAYLQPFNEKDPELSGLVFVPAQDAQGGLLMVNGLRPSDFKGEAERCTEGSSSRCRPFGREVYVYAKNTFTPDPLPEAATATTPPVVPETP
ncbi:PulJ/GspJ family protein [Anthocerotibacter panamensis]|uniref:PulJ/GspJ family protein n=1 Tax=Anthocerotibacter panamensis TaxID=2857077 RepID=UPI001C406A3B|nr:type II secretion system protein [Anthocerotibacter panamensis]